MPDPGLATAADYSEALLTARRAKSLIALILALMLIGQIATFLLLRYDIVRLPSSSATVADVITKATSQPTASETANNTRFIDLLQYLTGIMILGGIGLSIVLAFVLCLIGHVMLVGRLIGVGRVTSALVWALVLLVFLFPWQAFLTTDFHLSGVLWTWDELVARYNFDTSMSSEHWASTVLNWFRFAGAPAVALMIVLAIQLKSNRGLRMALGEVELLNEMMRQA
ncbi:MAG: hypothetical protein JWM57_3364 [Phycisphaerales bacterium]|nr:hypothetical protein [Phycisphaerales bacterium]